MRKLDIRLSLNFFINILALLNFYFLKTLDFTLQKNTVQYHNYKLIEKLN